ncbi:hypothetical protein [Flavobacterium sp. GNP002]
MNTSLNSIKKSILTFLVLLTFSGQLLAQSSPIKITELSSYLLNKPEANKQRMAASSSQSIEDLVFKSQSAVYLTNGIIKTFGDYPSCIYTDAQSLSGIGDPTIFKNNIEIINIKIKNRSDLNYKVDLMQFSEFSSLKYFYFNSDFTITEKEIANMIVNYNNQYSIFYKIDEAE